MNNKYFFSLLCIIVLALAPACNKKQQKTPSYSAKASKNTQKKEDVKKMIELDSTIFETEEDNNNTKMIKF